MEKWGYVRVSVDKEEQAAGWEEQHRVLKELGCKLIETEEASTKGPRPIFEAMLAKANREATPARRICICAAKMDRAFRDLSAADAAITSPVNPNVIWLLPDLSSSPLDPKDPTQMLLVRMMGAVAQFERDRLAERRAYGIAKAKKNGKYKGRKPTARAMSADVLRYKAKGMNADEIAKLVGIGRASVYRILSAAK
jgi:DNA invertase Pin-like site-specific DNA recombinase